MNNRLNARLDEETAEKLTYLIENTNQNATLVVKEALATYHAKVQQENARALDILNEVGFIGCGQASEDLSRDYKCDLGDILDDKL